MGLFGPRFILDEGTTDWVFDTYAWALENFGTDIFHQFTELVLPNDKFFPDKIEEMEDVAEGLFTRVRQLAGMENWPCRLVMQEDDADPVVGPVLLLQGAPSGPAGTFSVSGSKAATIEISYNPSQLKRPAALIATFAHELAHYLIHSMETPTPGGEEFEEHATDLVAVFLQLKAIEPKTVEPYLDKSLGKALKRAAKEMSYLSERIEKLRSIKSNKMVQSET